MRAIIIDDEQHCITTLAWNIKEYCPEIEIVAEAKNGEEGLVVVSKYKPDLVFLDIEMPFLSGIDMLHQIDDVSFKVIFTTAYNHYAIKAIKLSAIDYLLKPIDKDELIASIEKAKLTSQLENNTDKIHTFKHNLNSISLLQKITIPSNEGILFFDISSIINLEAQGNYTCIYFDDGTKVVSTRTLKEYEDALPEDLFFRCHNSHVINLKHIKKYIRGDGGFVELSHGREIEVSRRRKSEFMEKVGL
jgi:two-component system, LytTR family, response regulator